MSADSDIDVEEVLTELDEVEQELIELIESPEDNTEEIKAEVEDLFGLTKKVLNNYDGLIDRVEKLREELESGAEQAEQFKKRNEDVMDRLGYDRTDE